MNHSVSVVKASLRSESLIVNGRQLYVLTGRLISSTRATKLIRNFKANACVQTSTLNIYEAQDSNYFSNKRYYYYYFFLNAIELSWENFDHSRKYYTNDISEILVELICLPNRFAIKWERVYIFFRSSTISQNRKSNFRYLHFSESARSIFNKKN